MKYYIYLKSGRKIEVLKKDFEETRWSALDTNTYTKTISTQFEGKRRIIMLSEIESIEEEN